ncbi:hypothetical protein BGZ89_006670 [Linnemannia elongata]|nr:hypothetical protein BGZ89_006670 [Linnemannia elongata]
MISTATVGQNPVYGLENTAKDAYRANNSPTWTPKSRAPQLLPSDDAEASYSAPIAGLGDKDAQPDLGTMYEEGQGVPKGYQGAMDGCLKAVEQGDSEGQRRVGLLYALGNGVSQDMTVALDCCTNAADHGNVAAELDIGHL